MFIFLIEVFILASSARQRESRIISDQCMHKGIKDSLDSLQDSSSKKMTITPDNSDSRCILLSFPRMKSEGKSLCYLECIGFAKGQSPNKYGYGREYFVYHTDQIDPDRPGNMGLSVAPVAGEDERIEVREGESVPATPCR